MKRRQYEESNWEELYLTGSLDKLLVGNLNKYLDRHDIDKAHKLNREKLQITFYLHEETRKN